MKSYRFDPEADLIRVLASITGRAGRRTVRLALDTGSTTTILTPEIVAELATASATSYGER